MGWGGRDDTWGGVGTSQGPSGGGHFGLIVLRHKATSFCHQRGSQSSYGALVRWDKNPLVEIYRSPLVPRPNSLYFFVFHKKVPFAIKKNDLLEVARGGGGRVILVGVGGSDGRTQQTTPPRGRQRGRQRHHAAGNAAGNTGTRQATRQATRQR